MRLLRGSILAAVPLLLTPTPSPAAGIPLRAHPAHAERQNGGLRFAHNVGLGKVLSTKDGGQIFGFDIDQKGDDGVLASAKSQSSGELVSVETFNQNTGQITKSFAQHSGNRDSYAVNAVFAGDVALVTHFIQLKPLDIVRKYQTMNPVTAGKFTGKWTPPIENVVITQSVENQATSTSVLFATDPKQGRPNLIVSNIAANTFSKVIPLDPVAFVGGNLPQLGQYAAANQAVVALSPDGGEVNGSAPVNVLVDLTSGKQQQFTGFNNGPFHAGYVNGVAVDPNTGIAATTTELNAQVEFYNLTKKTGIAAVQLPCTGSASQINSGYGIANDPVNKLFLVSEPTYACKGVSGNSAIVVFDENGNFIESITGFTFVQGQPAPVINPSKRMGWAFGPNFNQLQQFFY